MRLIPEQCTSSKNPLKKSEDEDYVTTVSNRDYFSIILRMSKTETTHIFY
jgi:hypothetical protein